MSTHNPGRSFVVSTSVLAAACGLAMGLLGVAAAPTLAAPPAQGQAQPDAGNDVLRALRAEHPGVKTTSWNGRVMSVLGDMTTGKDENDAAMAFVQRWIGAFGVDGPDLRLSRVDSLSAGGFVYAFDQYIEGVPVEFGAVKVVARPIADGARVTFASAKLAENPEGGLAAAKVTAEQALERARTSLPGRKLEQWGQPELIVFFGEGDFESWTTPVFAWKMMGESVPDETRDRRWFFIDAKTNELIHIRSGIIHADIPVTVRAKVTPNNAADTASNPPVEVLMPNIRVDVTGRPRAFTDAEGALLVSNINGVVTIETGVDDGLSSIVTNDTVTGTPLLTDSIVVDGSSGPVELMLNETPSQFTTAMANAFYYQTLTRNYFKSLAPTFTGLDQPLNIRVNLISASGINFCNAFYDGSSTNYFQSGNGCNNTAFASVISHEYGHHIVNRLSLAQGAFGEGFSDTMSILIFDDPVIGRNFFQNGNVIRRPDLANQQYPCSSGASHTCGQILGGVVWRARNNFGAFYGSAEGLTRMRQLHADWALITNGGQGVNSAHPTMLSEFYAANDDDGTLSNGVPDYCRLAASFRSHGIEGESLPMPVIFSYPEGLPQFLLPGVVNNVRVDLVNNGATPTSGTAVLRWRPAGGGAFQTVALQEIGPGQFIAPIPGPACGSSVEFSFQVDSTQGMVFEPNVGCLAGAPYSAVGAASAISLREDFETDTGWLVGPTTATSGAWVRGDPLGTAAQPGDDVTPGSGVNCFFTGQGTNPNNVGQADVDGGSTVLRSPVYDLSGLPDVTVSYWRWFSNNTGASPNQDVFVVDVSTNGGVTWTRAETVGPASQNTGGWIFASWTLSSLGLAPTNQVRLRFIAEDAEPGSVVEAAIDEVVLQGYTCDAPPPCAVDWNNDDAVDDLDIAAFFADFEVGEGDFNGDDGVDDLDISAFFAAFEQGC